MAMVTSRVPLNAWLILALLCFQIGELCAANSEDVENLFNLKVKNLNPKIRPVKNQSHVVDVEFGVHIVALTDVNEVQQTVEATIWMEVVWKNELLMWDPVDFGNLTSIYSPEENIWKPALTIGNNYKALRPLSPDFTLLISGSDGRTTWYPGDKIEFLCKIDVTKFPFDTQSCYFEIFNWSGLISETTLKYREGVKKSVDGLYANSEWTIIERKSETFVKTHEMVRVHLKLQRKSLSLVLTVLLPVILLSFLNVFVFLLPTESGEKLSFAITVLLSQAVFLSFISSLMPQTSDSISGLSIYISTQLVLSTVYVLLTCCILRIYHMNIAGKPLPRWLLKFVCITPEGDNVVKPFTEHGKTMTADVSQKLDKICFWVFFCSVFVMTSIYLLDGMSYHVNA